MRRQVIAAALSLLIAFNAEGCPEDGEAPKKKKEPRVVISRDGTWEVPEQVDYGTIKATKPGRSCNWEIVVKVRGHGGPYRTIRSGTEKSPVVTFGPEDIIDAFQTYNCGEWVRVK